MLSTDKQTDKQTDRQTDKLTNATKNITSFAKEVITCLVTLKQKIYKMLIVHLVINYHDGKKIFPHQNPSDEMISNDNDNDNDFI